MLKIFKSPKKLLKNRQLKENIKRAKYLKNVKHLRNKDTKE